MDRVAKAAPLLALLRKHEADGAVKAQGVPDAYSVIFSGIPKANRPKALLVTYPIREVIEWQRFVVSKGAKSSAAGAYQIIRSTLEGLKVDRGRIFDAACQDELALQLLDRRGWDDCEAGRMSAVDFADMLAREWASMPVQRAQRGQNLLRRLLEVHPDRHFVAWSIGWGVAIRVPMVGSESNGDVLNGGFFHGHRGSLPSRQSGR